jgi:hypothetical protein
LEGEARAAADADGDVTGDVTGDGDAVHPAGQVAVVVDRVVLGRAVVPDGKVAGGSAPAHGVLQPRDVPLE